jgi:hypothetical protein
MTPGYTSHSKDLSRALRDELIAEVRTLGPNQTLVIQSDDGEEFVVIPLAKFYSLNMSQEDAARPAGATAN